MSARSSAVILDPSHVTLPDMNSPKLTPQEVTQNYYAGYQLAIDIIRRQHKSLGFSVADTDMDVIELAQSVFGCERLVQLIQEQKFNEAIYSAVIKEEVDQLSKSLFPDVGKRRFVSIDKLHDDYNIDFSGEEVTAETPSISPFEILDYLQDKLSPENFTYLQQLFAHQDAKDRDFLWNDKIYRLIDQSVGYLEEKIVQMRRLYPDGIPFQQDDIDVKRDLTESEIIGCYKNVFLGIYSKFPVNFLSYDTLFRCAVMTRFAVESVLQKKPLDILKEYTVSDFASVGLTGVVRYFNYSLNRIIRNAYPDILMPWEQAHVEDGFWSDEHNRHLAIRWLVEEKLKIPRDLIPKSLRDDQIKKSTFVENGLSYMFVQYYKSVSRAIGSAYPELMPWELGSVPNSFWQGDEGNRNIVRAVQWMIRKMEIPISAIPGRIKDKTISRETFKQYGLSTVFERLFKKNMFLLFNAAYPGQFEIWEIGKVPGDHWDDLLRAYRAALWICKKERIDEKKIAKAIRTKRIRKETFAKYGLGGMLKKCFDNDLYKAYLPYILPKKQDVELFMRDVILQTIIQKQIRDLQPSTGLMKLLRHLFFKTLLSSVERTQIRFYRRIQKRVKQRMGEMVHRVMQEQD